MPRYTSDTRTASRECYKDFSDKHPAIKITFEQFKDIIYTYNEQYMHEIIETGAAIPLPYGLGKISIQRKKTTTSFTGKDGKTHILLPVDWVKTRETGKKQYFYNDHTEGWRYKWIWFKDSSTGLKMKDIWSFKPARKWSRGFGDILKGPNAKDYMYRYTEWQVGRNKTRRKKNAKLL